jgi:hypothetical protein
MSQLIELIEQRRDLIQRRMCFTDPEQLRIVRLELAKITHQISNLVREIKSVQPNDSNEWE